MTDVTPRPMPTPDLAGLLNKPRRHHPNVTSIEPPVPATTTESGATEDEPAQTTYQTHEEAPVGDHSAPPPGTPARKPSPSSTRNRRGKTMDAARSAEAPGRQYLRSMSIYLPRSLHQRLGQRADADGRTRTALILMAVNHTHDSIGTALNPESADTGSELFDIPQRTARKEPSVETTIRVTDRQLAAIDNLVGEHGANRSRLISVALQTYLG